MRSVTSTTSGKPERNAAIIVAAGRGTRASAVADSPKQYVSIAGRPVLSHTLAPFLGHPQIHSVTVVIHPDDNEAYEAAAPIGHEKLQAPVAGGQTRQASVLQGLQALVGDAPDHVLIHDAARPFVTSQTISAVIDGLDATTGTIAALRVSDTLKRGDADQTIKGTVDRDHLWRALTPQGFRFRDIYEAHLAAANSGRSDFTDDASIAEFFGHDVTLIEDQPTNIKITTPGDFALAERLLETGPDDVRTGQGYDVHRFTDGDHVWLCGLKIPHTAALDGHSDADVAMHALTDAILGAIADGDIGQHFPPSDPQWQGAASDIFLKDAVGRVAARGGRITNVDVTIICEAPKIGPHRDAMRARLTDIMGLDIDRIGVKATTSERLGFTGRREGIAAMATATVVLPANRRT